MTTSRKPVPLSVISGKLGEIDLGQKTQNEQVAHFTEICESAPHALQPYLIGLLALHQRASVEHNIAAPQDLKKDLATIHALLSEEDLPARLAALADTPDIRKQDKSIVFTNVEKVTQQVPRGNHIPTTTELAALAQSETELALTNSPQAATRRPTRSPPVRRSYPPTISNRVPAKEQLIEFTQLDLTTQVPLVDLANQNSAGLGTTHAPRNDKKRAAKQKPTPVNQR